MKRIVAISIFTVISFSLLAQAGIDNTTATPTLDASAALHVISANNDKGVLIPRLTDYQYAAIVKPANGLLVFDVTNNVFKYNSGTSDSPVWIQIGSTNQSLQATKDEGDIYINPTTKLMYFWNGTTWNQFETGTKL